MGLTFSTEGKTVHRKFLFRPKQERSSVDDDVLGEETNTVHPPAVKEPINESTWTPSGARDEDDLHYELIYHTQYDEQSDEVNPVLVDHDVIDQQVVDDLDTDSDETVSDDGTSETINDVEESDEESSANDTDETEHDDDPVGFNEEAYQQAHAILLRIGSSTMASRVRDGGNTGK